MGRYCEFELYRSGRRRDVDRLARVLRPLDLAQLTFEPPSFAVPNDCLVPVSVSTSTGGQRQEPLHCCRGWRRAGCQQRADSQLRRFGCQSSPDAAHLQCAERLGSAHNVTLASPLSEQAASCD
jgi:hypothetical protein